MNRDTWDVVINGQETYQDIWRQVIRGDTLLIAWTDGRGSMHDILFSIGKYKAGPINALHPALPVQQVLFVSILRRGAFGFDYTDENALHPDYVAEKLNVGGGAAEALAALLNGLKSVYAGKEITR